MFRRFPVRTTAAIFITLVACMPAGAFQSWEQARKTGSVEGYSEWLDATVGEVATFHDYFERAKVRGASTDTQIIAYKQLASKLKVPKVVEQIEFPEEQQGEQWLEDAKKAANAIKPKMNYTVDNTTGFKVIQGTTEAEKNLKDNIKVIAWYRDQIDEVCPQESESEGSHALAKVIDEFLAELGDSVPKVRVKLYGTTNMPDDKKLDYSDTKLWQMLSTINRYFYYKIQLHEEKKEALPADFLLMGAMVKTVALFGAAPPRKSLIEINAKLEEDDEGWKGSAYKAIKSWEKEINGEFQTPQKVCVIKLPDPPQPPKKDEGQKKGGESNEFPPDVEDVKELGGKIFIKRKGFWKLWEKGKKDN